MRTIIPIEIVTLGDGESYHLLVSGVINDQNYDLLIDTGASHTIFDATLITEKFAGNMENHEIQSAGIQAGELKSSIGHIAKFELGDLKRTDWTVILIDLTHVNDLYKRYTDKRIAGLIGGDFLLKHLAVIDYKRKELLLRNIRSR